MPECTTCGTHVTHEYVRVFGDNENSVNSCRNCQASAPESDAEDKEHDRVVHLEEVLGDQDDTGDEEETEPDATEVGERGPPADPVETTEASDDSGDKIAEEQTEGRFGLGRLRSLFGR